MCCSIRAAVFYLSSIHIYFAITQLVLILPQAANSFGENTSVSVLAIVFALFFFSAGFMVFRGADEESHTLIRTGAFLLALIIVARFALLYFDLIMVEKIKLPEASFLYAYGTTVPVIFTCILYIFYLAILFCYHNELTHLENQAQCDSPINFQSPRHLRQSQAGSDSIIP
ncbi:unnamed protein product [Allacma fusca]|uniref:Transmembrane protein n=1 Tax=Allacma fusca TaxID=39272 RepID=A0A8J2NWC6_9HEXA|nr:unnamed protein product [Allacma fusca]